MPFVTIPSPLRAIGFGRKSGPPLQGGSPTGHASPALRSRSTWSRTYDFFRTRPRGEGRGTAQLLLRRRPGQTRPCLVGDGFPPSGSRVWTCTSWSWFMPITPAHSVLRPLCLLPGLAADWHVRRTYDLEAVTSSPWTAPSTKVNICAVFRDLYSLFRRPIFSLERHPMAASTWHTA